MPSVDRRYVSKGLGFGFGEEMEENELEEGEAYYQDEDDVQLSSLFYIEERLHDVLGHFEKDFEGEVTAENLGAKFGGYGSFLPTYQRSPAISSQPRTPLKVQSYIPPKSPNNPPSEDTNQDLKIPPHPSHSRYARPESASFYVENSTKRDVHLSTRQVTQDLTPNHASMNKSVKATDQKTLKVCIKVGSVNVSARKNAEIYSGLGLDYSPSSSFEESPVGSGELSPGYRDVLYESPTSILKILNSPFVSGGYPLSPLLDNLMHLTEKEKPRTKDSKPWNALKGTQESLPLAKEPMPVTDVKVFREKKKFVDRSKQAIEARNANSRNGGNDMSEKGTDVESSVDGEHFQKALKSSLPSYSKGSVEKVESQINGDIERGSGRASAVSKELNKGVVRDRSVSSDLVKGEILENGGNELVPSKGHPNSQTHSANTAQKDKNASSRKDILLDTVKDDEDKGDKRSNVFKVDSDEFMGTLERNGGSAEPSGQKAAQKTMSYEKDKSKMRKEKESKKKLKRNQSNGVRPVELPKGSIGVVTSATSQDKRESSKIQDPFSGYGNSVTKPHDSSTTFGRGLEDSAVQPDDNSMDPLELHFKGNLKDSKLVGESEAHVLSEKSGEKSSGKKVECMTTSKENVKAPAVPSLIGSGLASDAIAAPVDPVVIKENWVGCDKCQKWRLLPFGVNPDNLPKKWLCSMLYWLPGMNKCTISEEDTTKALNAMYQVPVPDSQHNLQSQFNGVGSGVTLADSQHLDQSHELSSHALPSSGKKRHGSKDLSNSLNQSSQNSIEKNQQVCAKRGSLNDAKQLPLESYMASKVSYQSPDIAVENQRHRQKEKHKLLDHYSDGGNHIEQSGKHLKDVIEKVVPSMTDDLPTKATGKKKQKHNNYILSKELKGDTRDTLPESRKKLTGQVQVPLDGEFKTQTGSSDFAIKKRKVKEWQEHQAYSETLPFSGHLSDNMATMKEEINESELTKKKKARPLKPEGKEYSASMKDGKMDKKRNMARKTSSGTVGTDPLSYGTEECRGGSANDYQLGQRQGNAVSQQALDGEDSLKRDLGCGQPSMAATSSSSKVSGSRKSKSNFQVRSSPVESVSSSPLKICNTDNLTTARSNILGENDAANVGLLVVCSPRQCSDGETDGRIDRSRMARKEKGSSVVQHAFVTSQRVEERDANQISCGEGKDGIFSKAFNGRSSFPSYSEHENVNVANGSADISDQHNPYLSKVHDHGHASEKSNNHYSTNWSGLQKPGKSSSRSRDKRKSAKSDFDMVKVSECFSEQDELHPITSAGNHRHEARTESHEFSPNHENLRDRKHNYSKKSIIESDKGGKSCIDKKDLMENLFGDEKRDNPSKVGMLESSDSPMLTNQHMDPSSRGGKLGADCSKGGESNLLHNRRQVTCDDEKSTNQFLSESTDPAEIASDRGKLVRHPPSGDRQEMQSRHPRGTSTPHKGSKSDVLPVDASSSGELKEMKQPRKSNSQNEVHYRMRHSTPNSGIVGRDLDAPSLAKKDSGQAFSVALKEAKDLKHTADRLANGGLELDRTGLYFQAALKFLCAASLLELCNVESAKHGETTQSMQVYIETASLCEFCAHGYERCKEMAAAALAYKCMEVAHLRVIYSKQYIAGKDRHELQSMLQVAPLGESPSSSASDVDNLNNQATLEKVALTRGVSASRTAGNLIVTPRNRFSMQRLLQYVNHMDNAIEALKKSRNALAAANVGTEKARYGPEGISSVGRVLEFNFHDVEGLLQLVRLALEAISP
ncbi:hypothetical protein AAC387_Pa03g2137 [Persea americana]